MRLSRFWGLAHSQPGNVRLCDLVKGSGGIEVLIRGGDLDYGGRLGNIARYHCFFCRPSMGAFFFFFG